MTKKVIPLVARSAEPKRGAAPRFAGGMLLDTMGRPMRDLRISVTDRCNFRCRDCMPREVFDANYRFLPQAALLSFEEIARLAGVFVGLGVEKIRLTGGEPLVRRDVDQLIAKLKDLKVEITLTTNGSLLAKQAGKLARAGLNRVTVSLDSLDDATFRAMNDADFPVAKVIEGIEAAHAAGLSPIKIKMVVKRGVNDGGILAMAERWRGTGHGGRLYE
jgi:cyclic pyranopterin phosphate synthase